MADLRITHVSVLTEDGTILKDQTVDVTDGRFSKIAPASESSLKVKEPGKAAPQVLDGCGKLLMPGLADCHMHTGQQLLKGLVLDAKPIIWTRIMLPFESTLTPDKMRLCAQAAALEMIKSGTTAFVDAGSYYMAASI